MLADSHCHLNDPAYDEDRDTVIENARHEGFRYILNVGFSLPNSRLAIDLAERYDFLYASVGIHPHQASEVNDAVLAELRAMAAHPKVVAIGESGLDYYRDRSPRDAQRAAFRAHIALARETGKPIIVHCRDAMEDCLAILEQERVKDIGGIMHCFAGTPEDVRRCAGMGMFVSFAGNVTYAKAEELRASLSVTPGHRLLLETDAPYLSPQKKRSKRNDPVYLRYIVEQAAQTRGVTVEDIERIIVTNFETVFKIGGVHQPEIAYKIRNSLYLNVTRSCTNQCHFCARYYSDTVQGHHLRLAKDPTAQEMIDEIGDSTRYDEIVFCGYGEPTLKLDEIKAVAVAVKAQGGKTRLNTNGHGNHIAKRDITPELAGLIDSVSISLNAQDAETYNRICDPQIPDAYTRVVEFIRLAKNHIPHVTATVVAIPGEVGVERCRKIAEEELGVSFRIREYDIVG